MTDVALTERDVAYVRANYVPLDELLDGRDESADDIHELIERRLLPQPSYVLPDGTEMFPRDYFELVDAAGSAEALPTYFAARYERAAAAEGVAPLTDEEWDGYLSGVYAVCLRSVTPETIARKGVLVDSIRALLADPRPEDDAWRSRLRTDVDELDELERPFSPDHDRVAFGKAPTRDELVAGPRERYADVFATVPT